MSTKILAEGRYRDHALLLLRLVAGLLFFQAGAMKIFGWYGGVPDGGLQVGIGGVLEIVGGIAIALGLLTRPVAFILAGEMAVAYWQFHFPIGGWPIQNGGQPAVLFCFLFLHLAAAGAGRFSLDAARTASRRRTREDLRRGVEREAHDRLDGIHADARGEDARVAHEEVVEAV